MTIYRIARRNLGRNRKRTLLGIGAIALAQATLIFVTGFIAGSRYQMLQTITGPMIGHAQVHHPKWREERAVDLYIDGIDSVRSQTAALPEVESVSPRLYSAVLAASGEKGDQPANAEPAMIVGIDPSSEATGGGLLESLPAPARPHDKSVAVGRILANRLHVLEGQQLAIIGQDVDGFPQSDLFTIGAVIDSPVDLVKTRGIVMSLETAGEFLSMRNQAHEVVIRGTNLKRAESLAREVSVLPAVTGMEILSWREAVPDFSRMLEMQSRFDLIFLAIVFIAAASGIANTSMMSTFERTREFGMQLAIGLRPSLVVRMVLVESVLLGLIGVVVGSITGLGLVMLTAHTGIDYARLAGVKASEVAYAGVSISYTIYPRLELRPVLLGFFAVTFTSALASIWPAMSAARLEPAKAMRP